jgi:hypothetical protein
MEQLGHLGIQYGKKLYSSAEIEHMIEKTGGQLFPLYPFHAMGHMDEKLKKQRAEEKRQAIKEAEMEKEAEELAKRWRKINS